MVKTRLYLGVVVLAMVALMFGACSKSADETPIVGGPCEYVDIPGIARVVSASEATPADWNCKNALEVIFDFVPDDPTAIDDYLFPNWKDTGQRLTVGGGMNPPKTWVLEQGLTEGSKHHCVRSEITKGTCTPVIFRFPEIDMEGWKETCFEKSTEPESEGPPAQGQTQAIEIAKEYVEAMDRYVDYDGRDLKVTNVIQARCPGCWQVELEFYLASEKDPKRTDKATVRLTLENWEVVDTLYAQGGITILTPKKEQHIIKEVEVPVDGSLTIALYSCPSEGREWTEAQISDRTVLEYVDNRYIPSEVKGDRPPPPGTPGQEVWTFKALEKGMSTISMEYTHPWEGGEKEPMLTFNLTVVVK